MRIKVFMILLVTWKIESMSQRSLFDNPHRLPRNFAKSLSDSPSFLNLPSFGELDDRKLQDHGLEFTETDTENTNLSHSITEKTEIERKSVVNLDTPNKSELPLLNLVNNTKKLRSMIRDEGTFHQELDVSEIISNFDDIHMKNIFKVNLDKDSNATVNDSLLLQMIGLVNVINSMQTEVQFGSTAVTNITNKPNPQFTNIKSNLDEHPIPTDDLKESKVHEEFSTVNDGSSLNRGKSLNSNSSSTSVFDNINAFENDADQILSQSGTNLQFESPLGTPVSQMYQMPSFSEAKNLQNKKSIANLILDLPMGKLEKHEDISNSSAHIDLDILDSLPKSINVKSTNPSAQKDDMAVFIKENIIEPTSDIRIGDATEEMENHEIMKESSNHGEKPSSDKNNVIPMIFVMTDNLVDKQGKSLMDNVKIDKTGALATNETQPSEDEDHQDLTPYMFAYEVRDDDTRNYQNRVEKVEDGVLRGSFSFLGADGIIRTVLYIDDGNGFQVETLETVTNLTEIAHQNKLAENSLTKIEASTVPSGVLSAGEADSSSQIDTKTSGVLSTGEDDSSSQIDTKAVDGSQIQENIGKSLTSGDNLTTVDSSSQIDTKTVDGSQIQENIGKSLTSGDNLTTVDSSSQIDTKTVDGSQIQENIGKSLTSGDNLTTVDADELKRMAAVFLETSPSENDTINEREVTSKIELTDEIDNHTQVFEKNSADTEKLGKQLLNGGDAKESKVVDKVKGFPTFFAKLPKVGMNSNTHAGSADSGMNVATDVNKLENESSGDLTLMKESGNGSSPDEIFNISNITKDLNTNLTDSQRDKKSVSRGKSLDLVSSLVSNSIISNERINKTSNNETMSSLGKDGNKFVTLVDSMSEDGSPWKPIVVTGSMSEGVNLTSEDADNVFVLSDNSSSSIAEQIAENLPETIIELDLKDKRIEKTNIGKSLTLNNSVNITDLNSSVKANINMSTPSNSPFITETKHTNQNDSGNFSDPKPIPERVGNVVRIAALKPDILLQKDIIKSFSFEPSVIHPSIAFIDVGFFKSKSDANEKSSVLRLEPSMMEKLIRDSVNKFVGNMKHEKISKTPLK